MLSSVSILIPTFRRSHLLPGAVASCLNQRGFGHDRLEVVVVDNSPEGAAEKAIAGVTRNADALSPRVIYIHDPRPGISHARNTALQASSGDFVLFLDDDQIASPDLVSAYYTAWQETRADAYFGPVRAEAESGGAAAAWILHYHSRNLPSSKRRPFIARRHARGLGSSNSFFVRSTCLPCPKMFEESLGEVGGEDTLLLRQLLRQGRRFAWVDEAVVRERVSSGRLLPGFVRWRRFRSGQIQTLTCLLLVPPQRADAALWMAIGASQVVLYGLLTPLFYLAGREHGDELWSRMFGGLGKVLWTERFMFPAYGSQAQLPR